MLVSSVQILVYTCILYDWEKGKLQLQIRVYTCILYNWEKGKLQLARADNQHLSCSNLLSVLASTIQRLHTNQNTVKMKI